MPIIAGNTTGSIASIPYNIPSTIKSIVLTSMNGGTVTVNMSIVSNSTGDAVSVFQGDISDGLPYSSDTNILMLGGFAVVITTSGSLDYYITVE